MWQLHKNRTEGTRKIHFHTVVQTQLLTEQTWWITEVTLQTPRDSPGPVVPGSGMQGHRGSTEGLQAPRSPASFPRVCSCTCELTWSLPESRQGPPCDLAGQKVLIQHDPTMPSNPGASPLPLLPPQEREATHWLSFCCSASESDSFLSNVRDRGIFSTPVNTGTAAGRPAPLPKPAPVPGAASACLPSFPVIPLKYRQSD